MKNTFKQKRAATENLIATVIDEALDHEDGKRLYRTKNILSYAAFFACAIYVFVYILTTKRVINVISTLISADGTNANTYTSSLWLLLLLPLFDCLQSPKNIFDILGSAFILLLPALALCFFFVFKKIVTVDVVDFDVPITWAIVCFAFFLLFFCLRQSFLRAKRKELRLIAKYTDEYYTIPCNDADEFQTIYPNVVRKISYCKIIHAVIALLFPLVFFIPFIEIMGENVSIFTFVKEALQKGFDLIRDKETTYFFLDMYFATFEEISAQLFKTSNLETTSYILGGIYLFLIGFAVCYCLFYGIKKIVTELAFLRSLDHVPTTHDYISKQEILKRAAQTKQAWLVSLPVVLFGIALACLIVAIPAYLHYQFYMQLTDGKLGGVDELFYSVNPLMLFIPLLFYALIVLFPLFTQIFIKSQDEIKSVLWHFPLQRATLWSKYQKRL